MADSIAVNVGGALQDIADALKEFEQNFTAVKRLRARVKEVNPAIRGLIQLLCDAEKSDAKLTLGDILAAKAGVLAPMKDAHAPSCFFAKKLDKEGRDALKKAAKDRADHQSSIRFWYGLITHIDDDAAELQSLDGQLSVALVSLTFVQVAILRTKDESLARSSLESINDILVEIFETAYRMKYKQERWIKWCKGFGCGLKCCCCVLLNIEERSEEAVVVGKAVQRIIKAA
ncbi:hypothetical protein M885DRAFT_507688 [Pelagophyceae sp. CCMP2097]|nr:hypothetical protein M885DRAFT_507688 [Pelagophyceae sp. CCMP2097]